MHTCDLLAKLFEKVLTSVSTNSLTLIIWLLTIELFLVSDWHAVFLWFHDLVQNSYILMLSRFIVQWSPLPFVRSSYMAICLDCKNVHNRQHFCITCYCVVLNFWSVPWTACVAYALLADTLAGHISFCPACHQFKSCSIRLFHIFITHCFIVWWNGFFGLSLVVVSF